MRENKDMVPELHTKTPEEAVEQYRRREQEASRPPALPPKMEDMGFFHDKGHNIGFAPNPCVRFLQSLFQILTLADGTLCIYNQEHGIWDPLSKTLLGVLLMHLMNLALPDSWRVAYGNQVYIGLLNAASRAEPIELLEHLIPVANGVYDLERKKLLPHHANYLLRSQSPVRYDPAATCPLFLKTVEEICCGDDSLVKLLQETFGYCFLSTCKAEKGFFWLGVGANGKSLLSDILRALIGERNVSQVQLASFSTQFGLEAMIGKQLNIASENEMEHTMNSEALKALISGDMLNIARKYQSDLQVRQTTKLIFLLNNLPESFDQTHGFFRKMIVTPFERVFTPAEMDRDRKAKLLGELSGILNWSLEGAARLIRQGYCFTKCEAAEYATQNYQREQNPVAAFYKERLAQEKGQKAYRDDILEAYEQWLAEEELSARGTNSPQKFWKLLQNTAKSCGVPKLHYKKNQGKRYLVDYRIKP